MSELSAKCPFCGSRADVRVREAAFIKTAWVECSECYACGPRMCVRIVSDEDHGKVSNLAIEAWERRSHADVPFT